MTTVRARRGGGSFELAVSGHTDSRACAGVSAIVCALEGYLENTEGPDLSVARCRVSAGAAEFRFSGGAEAESAWRMAVIGLMRIAAASPELVAVTV